MDWTPLFIVAVIAFVVLRLARARNPAVRRSRVLGLVTGVLGLGLLVVGMMAVAVVISVLGNRGP